MTIDEATEIMRAMTGEPPGEQCRAMMELADVWEEAEEMVACGCDDGSQDTGGETPWGEPISAPCNFCSGTGFVSNGNSLRAEALRLLAECGKVGNQHDQYYTPRYMPEQESHAVVPVAWWNAAIRDALSRGPVFGAEERAALLDAYAVADQPTREAWARETRKLAGWVACGCRKWMEGGYACPVCQGYGLVPPAPTEVLW